MENDRMKMEARKERLGRRAKGRWIKERRMKDEAKGRN